MKGFLTQKVLVVTVVALVALVAASIGVAYWTGVGSGSATGTVGTSGALTLSGTVAPGLVPGGSEAVAFTASNAGTSAVQVGTIHLASVAVDAGHSACLTADLTMPDITETTSVAAGATAFALPTGGVLTYANTALNQDACKSATLTLTLTSN